MKRSTKTMKKTSESAIARRTKSKQPYTPTRFIRKYVKMIAAFFILNFLTSLFAPNIAYALTGGPTNPDYTSFEPVDTTDMVNLLSGDLAYNIPLLEVPGPAGGYPLSLSYHAGIMLNEEASWVGLGWTLNPGAINRSVNGFVDDHKNVTTTDRFFWEGGERSQVDVGVNIGIGDMVGVSAGISIGTDTYQGFGVGGFAGANANLFKFGGDEEYGVGASARIGVDPWGNGYQSFGVSLGTQIEGLTFSAGANTNFQSVGFSGGVSANYGGKPTGIQRGGISLVGASISSQSGGASVSVVGASGVINNKSGDISTSSVGFVLPIPFVYLGFKKTRYWIDETENIATNGALYYPDYEVSTDWLDDHAYDTYYATDAGEFTPSGLPQLDGAKSLGGSFANYDHYAVSGQGLAGVIKPYKYQQHLLHQNQIQEDETIQFVTGYDNDQSFQWRFVNDFSNRIESKGANISSARIRFNQSLFNFKNLIIGEEGQIGGNTAGSKSIKTYTNKEIVDERNRQDWSLSVMENSPTGFRREHLPWDQIGAYVITNESGVSYHYTLPACSYDEYQYSENIERGKGHSFNSLDRSEEYAYAWHLTAITGPDFVDRNQNGKLDTGDWGYWVDFEYGKWTEQYFWRNPGEGMHLDLDNNFQNFTEGTKELYYLDAIKTKSHTALFVKDIREDNRSVIPILKSSNNGGKKPIDEAFEGGFEEKNITSTCRYTLGLISDYGTLTYAAKSTKSLKLEKIILIENKDVNQIK